MAQDHRWSERTDKTLQAVGGVLDKFDSFCVWIENDHSLQGKLIYSA